MTCQNDTTNEIVNFINSYYVHSQKRGPMYGTIAQLEHSWELLNHIYFMAIGMESRYAEMQFSQFLTMEGFGAEDVSHFLLRTHAEHPYQVLNEIWTRYIEWRDKLLHS